MRATRTSANTTRMSQYVAVCEQEDEEPMEIPVEPDGTLLLSSLVAQFPGATGLRYRPQDSKSLRGLRLADGKIYSPEDGWDVYTFVCNMPKENKRKPDDFVDNAVSKRSMKNNTSDLIVLGLPWSTTDEELKEAFSKFGEIQMSQVKKDPKTGKSKGFGFIKFAEYDSQMRVLGQRHIVDGRQCDVKLPHSRGEAVAQQFDSKVFIGRVTEDITSDDLKKYFGRFGEITDIYIPKPFRGFAFITFLNPAIAQALCGEDHIVKGTSLHVANATPKNKPKQPMIQGNFPGQENQSGPNSNPFNMSALAMPMLAALSQHGWGVFNNMQQGTNGGGGGGGGGSSGGYNQGNGGYDGTAGNSGVGATGGNEITGGGNRGTGQHYCGNSGGNNFGGGGGGSNASGYGNASGGYGNASGGPGGYNNTGNNYQNQRYGSGSGGGYGKW